AMLQPGNAMLGPAAGRGQRQSNNESMSWRGHMSHDRPWLQSSPAGLPAAIDVNEFKSVGAVFDASVARFRDRPAYSNLGKTITYDQADELVTRFACYLLNELQLKKGDRVALMMPNCLQYPIATFGI